MAVVCLVWAGALPVLQAVDVVLQIAVSDRYSMFVYVEAYGGLDNAQA